MRGKHYFAFEKSIADKMSGNMLNENNWGILRTDEKEGPFSIEKDVESYERNCKNATQYKNVAEKICGIFTVEKINCKKIISLGMGKGILEWHLKKINPKLVIECTDYTKNAIEQLKIVFKEMDSAYQFDILNGDYSKLDVSAIFLMYRISTEFSLEEWQQIFKKMYDAGVRYIVFIPTGLDNLFDLIWERLVYILNILRGRKIIQCGWLYSRKEYHKMFVQGGYSIKKEKFLKKTAIYLLEIK